MSMNDRVCGRVVFACALAMLAPTGTAWSQTAAGRITLAEALDRARTASPIVGIANADLEAARAREKQAGVGLNPELSYQVENFGGQGPYRSFVNSEATVGLSQTLELGGKRGARREAAGKLADATSIRSQIVRADLDLAVRERFAILAASEERIVLAQGAVDRANRLSILARNLVDAGREPPLRLLRAQAAEAEARAELNVVTADHSAAQRALTALWGASAERPHSTGPWEFQRANEQSVTMPDQTLDYRLAEAEHDRAEAALRLEKANAWIDVTVDAGFRSFRSTGEQALVAGVRVPIPIRNRNKEGIAAAHAEDRSAELSLSLARIEATRRINDARAAFEAANARAAALEEQAVRQAEEALSLARTGYEAGRFQLIDVLDAEQVFASIRNASIEARLARARAAAAVIRANAR